MRTEGLCDYIQDFWNMLDVTGFLAFWSLFVDHLFLANDIPKDPTAPIHIPQAKVFLKILVIVQMLLKVNYFLRVYEKFGLLVNLLATCVKEMIPFCVYLFMYVLLFVMLYFQSGIHPPRRDGFAKLGFGE